MSHTQEDINKLLQSSDDVSSVINVKPNVQTQQKSRITIANESKHSDDRKEGSEEYDNQQFESFSNTMNNRRDYEQSHQSYNQQEFESFQQSRRSLKHNELPKENRKPLNQAPKSTKKLLPIQQQEAIQKPPQRHSRQKNKTANNFHRVDISSTQQNRTASGFNKKKTNLTTGPAEQHLPHNYVRIQDRERQLLFTRITEQNKVLKLQIASKDKDYIELQAKYRVVLDEKNKSNSTARQKAFQKQIFNLKNKIQKLNTIIKVKEKSNTPISHLSKTQQRFIPQEQCLQKEHQLLEIIQKLKSRLLHSDSQLSSVQRKMNEEAQFSQQLQRKLKRVEQLQYKLEKMTDQAEADRMYIETLKESIKELEKKVHEQKNRVLKLEVINKRGQMAGLTNNDLVNELREVKREKQQLEHALKDMSSTIMGNVVKNLQNSKNNPHNYYNLEDSDQLIKAKPK